MNVACQAAARATWLEDVRVPGLLSFALAAGCLTVMMLGGTIAPGYVLGDSAISDLGVIDQTALLFNGALVVVGALQAAASVLFYRLHRRGLLLGVSLGAAVGAGGVGLVPLDQGGLHSLFAVLAFMAFNLQAILTAPLVRQPLRAISWLAGLAGICFVIVMAAGDGGSEAAFGPIGHGGVERMIVYPPLLWLMAFGGYLMAGGLAGGRIGSDS